MQKTKNEDKRKMIIMILFMIAIFMTYNIGHPSTPDLIKLRNLNENTSGIFLAAMSLTMFFSSPYLGALADYFGRKKIFMFMPFGYGIGQLLFVSSGSLTLMILSRLLAGIFSGATYSIAYGYISDLSKKEEKSKNISMAASMVILGGAVGAYIGGKVGLYSSIRPFQLQFILGIVILILAAIFIKETKIEKSATMPTKNLNPFAVFKYINELDKKLKVFTFIIFLSSAGIFSYNSALNYFYKFNRGYSSDYIGKFTMISSCFAFIGTIILLPRLLKKYKEINIYKAMLVFGVVLMIGALSILYSGMTPYILFSIYTMTYEIIRSLGNSIMAHHGKKGQGRALGIATGMGSLGMSFGSLLSGYLRDVYQYLPFISNVLIMGIVTIVIFLYFKKGNNL